MTQIIPAQCFHLVIFTKSYCLLSDFSINVMTWKRTIAATRWKKKKKSARKKKFLLRGRRIREGDGSVLAGASSSTVFPAPALITTVKTRAGSRVARLIDSIYLWGIYGWKWRPRGPRVEHEACGGGATWRRARGPRVTAAEARQETVDVAGVRGWDEPWESNRLPRTTTNLHATHSCFWD